MASLPDRARAVLTALAGHVVVALVATFPMVLSPGARLLGTPIGDVWNHAWGPWWFWSMLSDGQLPLQTELLGSPAGGRLWFVDPVGALVSAPLVPLFGAVFAYNMALLFHSALASFAGHRLATVLGAGRWTAWLGAVGTACSPFVLSELHNGVSEATSIGPAVLVVALLIQGVQSGGKGVWVALGVVTGLCAITPYFALGTAAVGLAWLPWGLFKHRQRLAHNVAGGLAALLIGGLVVAPILMAIQWTVAELPKSLIFRPPDLEMFDILFLLDRNAVDPRTFVMPGDFQSVDASFAGDPFLHTSYLGWILLALAAWSRRADVLLAACLGFVFSLGPWLFYDGGWVGEPQLRYALPYSWLFDVLPAGGLGHPQRLGMPGIALVACAGAAGLERVPWPRARPVLGALAVLELLFASPAPWPVPRADALDTRVHAQLTAAPDAQQNSVLDLPAEVGRSFVTSRYLMLQTVHGLPLPYKPDVRANTSGIGGSQAFRNLIGEGDGKGDLARNRVRWVVVHGELYDADEHARVTALLTGWFGPPTFQEGDHAAWDTLARP